MPELPEVETTRRGIAVMTGRRIAAVRVRDGRLRWPVPDDLAQQVTGQRVVSIARRAKYLLIRLQTGTLIVHLGMSGSLRLVPKATPPGPHDHVDLVLSDGEALRLTDPRRFGCVLWTAADPLAHPLLAELGPEPLDGAFDGRWLFERSRSRNVAVKAFIMDGRVVVGVGNIYANEALHAAGIHPFRPAGRIALARYERLAACIREVLSAAIRQGGTTLRDFLGSDGRPGYFKQELRVYDREGEPCTRCGVPLKAVRQGQRATYYCLRCQR